MSNEYMYMRHVYYIRTLSTKLITHWEIYPLDYNGIDNLDQFASKSINRGIVLVIQMQKPLRSVNQCMELVQKHFSMLKIISRKPLYSV